MSVGKRWRIFFCIPMRRNWRPFVRQFVRQLSPSFRTDPECSIFEWCIDVSVVSLAYGTSKSVHPQIFSIDGTLIGEALLATNLATSMKVSISPAISSLRSCLTLPLSFLLWAILRHSACWYWQNTKWCCYRHDQNGNFAEIVAGGWNASSSSLSDCDEMSDELSVVKLLFLDFLWLSGCLDFPWWPTLICAPVLRWLYGRLYLASWYLSLRYFGDIWRHHIPWYR